MILCVLRESPDNSGTFVLTDQTINADGDDVLVQITALSAAGGRFAVYPYQPIRQTPSDTQPPPVADTAAAIAAVDVAVAATLAAQPVLQVAQPDPVGVVDPAPAPVVEAPPVVEQPAPVTVEPVAPAQPAETVATPPAAPGQ